MKRGNLDLWIGAAIFCIVLTASSIVYAETAIMRVGIDVDCAEGQSPNAAGVCAGAGGPLTLESIMEAELPGDPVASTFDRSKFFDNTPILITVKPVAGSDVSTITRIVTSSDDAGLQRGLTGDLGGSKYGGVNTV